MDLKLLTYNIFQRPYLVKSNSDDYKQERLPLMIEQFKHYDIVCLQEAFDLFTHRQYELLERAQKAGFTYFQKSTNADLFGKLLVDGGIVILSKYPIVDFKYQEFTNMAKADGITTKGILYCCVEVPVSSNGQHFPQVTFSFDVIVRVFLYKIKWL
jgi:endonuclease/exonuclease/phosphatase family metal-dependent hydrolase